MHGLIEERPLLQGSSSSPSSLDLAGSGIALILWVEHVLPNLFLGGDPAAGSPTATLLRLNPPCEAQIRHGRFDHASSKPHSGGSTGSVCKEQGRIHRTMMTCGY